MTVRHPSAAVSELPVPQARRAGREPRPRVPAPLTLACLAGAAVCAAAAAAGLWFMPFVVGVAVGVLGHRRRVSAGLLAATLAAIGGWAVPLLWESWHGVPVLATARVVAALAGLPALPEITLLAAAVTVSLAGLTGCLLGRAAARYCHR
jgi:hypothetical protein